MRKNTVWVTLVFPYFLCTIFLVSVIDCFLLRLGIVKQHKKNLSLKHLFDQGGLFLVIYFSALPSWVIETFVDSSSFIVLRLKFILIV